MEDAEGVWDFAAGCMRTYLALAAKARRFADDPDIREALEGCGAIELTEPTVGPYSPDVARTLETEDFEPNALAERGYRNERLDQLVVDLILGLR
jgi:xylose isomerase